jgi:hypothetical protein
MRIFLARIGMLNLPTKMTTFLAQFAPLFTPWVWAHAQVTVAGLGSSLRAAWPHSAGPRRYRRAKAWQEDHRQRDLSGSGPLQS